MKKCEDCKFFVGGYDECHKNPPVYVEGHQGGAFPLVYRSSWCGQWEARAERDRLNEKGAGE